MEPKEFIEKYEKDSKQMKESFENVASILSRHERTIKRLREEMDDVKKDMEEQDVVEQPPVEGDEKDQKIMALEKEVADLKAKLDAAKPAEEAPTEPEKKEEQEEPSEPSEPSEPVKKEEQEEEEEPVVEPEKPKVEKNKKKSLVEGKGAKEVSFKEVFSSEESARDAIKEYFKK